MFSHRHQVVPFLPAAGLALVTAIGCGPSAGVGEAEWPPVGKKWFDRAEQSFRVGDMEDARSAIDNALRVVPTRADARLLSAKVALAELEYDRALRALEGIESSEAASVRGRAFWYSGNLERAADELERLVADPDVRDPWAQDISKLARVGAGRKPFEIAGGLVAAVDMPRSGTASLIVPLELNGEPALGLIATGKSEAVIDSSAGAKSSWVSMRFGREGGGRVDVRDVPALAEDLSGISRQVNAPIKVLLGVNLLRHLKPTFDFAGSQFVVRTFEPPPPPVATTLKLAYLRGGGMLVRGAFGNDQTAPACSLLVDTSATYTVALDTAAWTKAGVKAESLQAVPGSTNLRGGILPMLRIGAFDVPRLPGLQGDIAVKEIEERLGVDLDGLMGTGLLANFRVTLADGGRTMWLEDLPREKLGPDLLTDPAPGLPDEGMEEEEEEAPPAKAPGKAPAKGGKAPAGAAAPGPAAPTGGAKPAAPAPKPPSAAGGNAPPATKP